MAQESSGANAAKVGAAGCPKVGAEKQVNAIVRIVVSVPSVLLVLAVRGYQRFISPLLPPMCRFNPSCSSYFILAVRKFGAIRGSWRGALRICRCHPFHPGGEDWP